ncbi:MAG: MBL fold metallo-hydrolase [Thermodesulfatator sp.]|nr:MAG: MBL fold metallo-hydrolase [Thermodesulfatator sp.]
MILKEYTVGPLQVRAYIIGCPDTKEAIVIDPAGSEKFLAETIKKLGLELKAIVNTHGHPDHTCGNARMKALTGAPVLMHKEDDELFREPEIVQMFRSWGFEAAPPADGYLEDGQELPVGNLRFRIIHTPGHSPGSVCIFGQGHLATGDTLFIDAVGRTDLPGGDMNILIKTLKERIIPLPDDTIVLPGHDYGPRPTDSLGNQKRTNPYLSNLV